LLTNLKEVKPEPVEKKMTIEEQLSQTRIYIKECIKKLDQVSKERNQSFEKSLDQLFTVQLRSTMRPLPHPIYANPEEQFRKMIERINDRYGEEIRQEDDKNKEDVNQFIDYMGHLARKAVYLPPNPQSDEQ
jgi:hypothetical protein